MSIYNKIHDHKETLAAREKMTADERKKAELNDLQEIAEATAAIASSIVDTLYQAEQQKTTQRLAEVDKREQYELSTVGDNEAAKNAIAAKYDAERKQLQRQADVQARNKALFDILINTSVAVVKALPNVALATLIGGLGLLEYGLTAGRPLPQYFAGKNIDGITNDNYAGPAIAGERGMELWQHDGRLDLVSNPSLINVGRNDVIYPHSLTEQILNRPDLFQTSVLMNRAYAQQVAGYMLAQNQERYRASQFARGLLLHPFTIQALAKAIGKENGNLPLKEFTFDARGYASYVTTVQKQKETQHRKHH